MEFSISCILLLSVVIFVAGIIDSIAGGGGLLTIPAYMFIGIPPQHALGTNKFVSCAGTGVAVWNFVKNKKIILKIIIAGTFFSIAGSIVGAKAILIFNQALAGKIITMLLPLGLVAVLIPKNGTIRHEHELTKTDIWIITPLVCFALGFYDGFFGPGAGSFLAIVFYFIMKLDLVKATGNAKIFNFTSNLGSLIAFIFAGKVLYSIALPLVASSMLGNYIGSHFAIRKGTGFIKFFLTIALIFVFFSLFIKYFHH